MCGPISCSDSGYERHRYHRPGRRSVGQRAGCAPHLCPLGPVQEVGYKNSIAVFEHSHPNISVSVELSLTRTTRPRSTSSSAPGRARRVLVNTPWLATWEQDGIMENLALLIKKYHVDMSIYRPALVALHSHNGTIMVSPRTGTPKGFSTTRTTLPPTTSAPLRACPGPDEWWQFPHFIEGGDHRQQR